MMMKKPSFLAPKGTPTPADVHENRQRTLKNGAYATLLTAAVLAVLVLLNLVVGAIPAQFTRLDISLGQMFTLTETTKELLGGLDRDVTAYYLGETGQEDTNITQLLDRYAGQSSHFTWQQRDPALYPTFARQYDAADATRNSVILVCGDNSALVDYTSMYEVDYSNYYTTGAVTSFTAENALTTGLAQVLRTEAWVLYQLTGHGEVPLDAAFTQTLGNAGVAVQDLDLAVTGAIPQDAAVLLINAPQQADYSTAELALLREYLDGGGRLLVTTDLFVATPALDALLEEYGLARQQGLVFEGEQLSYDRDHALSGYPFYLVPELGVNDVTSGVATGMYVVAPLAQPIAETGDNNFSYYSLLTTTDAAYLVDPETLEQVGTDAAAAPYDVAMAVADVEQGSKIAWFGCANVFTAEADEIMAGGNAQLLGSTVNWLNDQENAAVIDAKSMSGEALSVPGGIAMLLGLLFVIALPVGGIVVGAVRCLLRRRR